MKRTLVFFGLISALLVVFLAGCPWPTDPDKLTAASAFDLTALVTAPVNGAAPPTTIGIFAQYTGTISWQPPHPTFAPSTTYQATITLTATTGYTFVGVGANSFSYTGATSITNVAGSGGTIIITITFPATISPSTGQQLADDLNAVSPGSVSASGDTVTLLEDLAITGSITVPEGVTLDLASNHKSLILNDNAVLTVDGAINAEAARDSKNFIAGNGKLLVNSAIGSPATINGAGVIHLKSQGSLLFIENGKGLILDGVTLDGFMPAAAAAEAGIALPSGYEDDGNNNLRLVEIMQGAALTMQSGVIGYNGAGGVGSSGVFDMSGGEIKNNYIFGGNWRQGAGIYVQSTGVFTMYGGEIKGNNAEDEGGGVYVTAGGTFIMAGGTVYGSGAEPGLANITGVSPRGGAALYAPIGRAWWGDGATEIPSKSYQEGTLHGGTPTGTVGSPETDPPEDSTVNALNLSALVTVPESNATPNTTAINTAQYTGTITWQPPHPTFAPSTAYQATVSLTAKIGYTFTGVGANSFTHTGMATITNPAGNGAAITVTITFPQTAGALEPVTDITGVPSSGTAGVNLALSGTVSPAGATNKTIAWSVKTSGTTAAGAGIAGNTLSTTGAGIVVVTATIANGTAAGTNYTKDFTITITAAPVSSGSAEQLVADLNAISSGSASASGETVILLKDLTLTGSITVPAGVTLDLASNHKSLTLGDNAVLTVTGAVNAEAASNSTSFIAGNGKLLVNSAIGSPATINGAGVIHLKSQGSLLYIGNGKGLTLDGVTLDGFMTTASATEAGITLPSGYEDDGNNDRRLVEIMQGAALTMQSGVIGYNGAGGVGSSGVFNMHGGEIKNNYIFGGIWKQGAGIYVQATGVFTMYGGEIKGNNAEDEGGGVYVTQGNNGPVILHGTFIMAGGTVYGSDAEPGLANITGVSPRGGAALYAPLGNAWWGDGSTEIPSKSYQEKTLRGGNPTGTVGSSETEPPEDSTVSALNLTALITAPVKGAIPATAIGAAAQYTGTITWQPAHTTFVPSTSYQATVSLMAETGFTFGGVGANSFTYAGATSITNPAGSGNTITVAIGFPETGAPTQYTVTFEANGGTPVPATQTVTEGGMATEPGVPAKLGYDFGGWYKETGLTNQWDFAVDTVTAATTLYAQWLSQDAYIITLNLDAGDGAFSQSSFDISGTDIQTVTIIGSGYTNPRWYVDGDLKGTGTSIAIGAADYSVGKHNLALLITKSGVSWSKEITFTVN
jgi:uncharacterized repeat protein (TIGR02543 family)